VAVTLNVAMASSGICGLHGSAIGHLAIMTAFTTHALLQSIFELDLRARPTTSAGETRVKRFR
jgi:hypothetical protein